MCASPRGVSHAPSAKRTALRCRADCAAAPNNTKVPGGPRFALALIAANTVPQTRPLNTQPAWGAMPPTTVAGQDGGIDIPRDKFFEVLAAVLRRGGVEGTGNSGLADHHGTISRLTTMRRTARVREVIRQYTRLSGWTHQGACVHPFRRHACTQRRRGTREVDTLCLGVLRGILAGTIRMGVLAPGKLVLPALYCLAGRERQGCHLRMGSWQRTEAAETIRAGGCCKDRGGYWRADPKTSCASRSTTTTCS